MPLATVCLPPEKNLKQSKFKKKHIHIQRFNARWRWWYWQKSHCAYPHLNYPARIRAKMKKLSNIIFIWYFFFQHGPRHKNEQNWKKKHFVDFFCFVFFAFNSQINNFPLLFLFRRNFCMWSVPRDFVSFFFLLFFIINRMNDSMIHCSVRCIYIKRKIQQWETRLMCVDTYP